MIYHITSRAAWIEAQAYGSFRTPSLAVESFIHCSRRDQVLSVANDFYRGHTSLLLLCIDESKLSAELRWEAPVHPRQLSSAATSADVSFPHLYGPLNLDAVVGVFDLRETAAGYKLPGGLP